MTRICLAGAFTLVICVAATACGGAGEDATDGELREVTLQDTAGAPGNFISYGLEQGYFEQAGLDVQFEPSGGGATVIPALLSGELDIAGSNAVSAMLAMDRDIPVVMIAAGTSTGQEAEDDFAALMVPEDSPIEDPADLEGTELAVNTLENINDVVIHSLVEEAGADSSTVSYAEMPFPDMILAIERGDVDGGLLIEPFVSMAREAGLRSMASPFHALRPGLQIGTFLMTEELAAEAPELVEAFQEGVRLTAESISEDPDSFREALPEIADFDPELAQEANLPTWRAESDRESLELIHEVMGEIDMVDGEFDYAESVL